MIKQFEQQGYTLITADSADAEILRSRVVNTISNRENKSKDAKKKWVTRADSLAVIINNNVLQGDDDRQRHCLVFSVPANDGSARQCAVESRTHHLAGQGMLQKNTAYICC